MGNYSRRKFIRTSITGAIGLSMLPLLKSCNGANDTLRIGIIGLGRQTTYLVQGFNKIPMVKVVAGCDVYGIKRQRFENTIRAMQQEKEETVEVDTYEDYQDMLARTDIDVVAIVTPDHWHALQTLDACRAGKDIYLEKPATFTIKEGQEIVKAVRENNLVLAVGSQQRSDPNFQHAIRLVKEGRLGRVSRINAWVGPPPTPYELAPETVPADLNWEKWLGPNPYVHYNHRLNPPISLDPPVNEDFWAEWRYYQETGGGFICDWGAHNFDIAQWALDKDNGGPVKIIPAGYGSDYIHFVYEDGTVVVNEPFTEDRNFGVKFWGDESWVEVSRGHIVASDESLLTLKDEEGDDGLAYETGTGHLEDFIQCVRDRRDPIAPVEAGHRSGSLGILGNIATQLNRPLDWDPVKEQFVNDAVADTYLHREYREGYKLV